MSSKTARHRQSVHGCMKVQHGHSRAGRSTVAGVLGISVKVQIRDVGGDALHVGGIGGHQAAYVISCMANTKVRTPLTGK